mmetsp:Transcript_16946/g.47761  ORF Transcript_16946/g.47761 Transcript_16946/m.47761 type:complete len:89 (+) Transcript_16946:28-294(+)
MADGEGGNDMRSVSENEEGKGEEDEEMGEEKEVSGSSRRNKSKHWSIEETRALVEAELALYRGYRIKGARFDPIDPDVDPTTLPEVCV